MTGAFGIVGAGAVGLLLARELRRGGEQVWLWNRSGVDEVPPGARVVPSLAELVESTDTLVLCVAGSALPELDRALAPLVAAEGARVVLHTCGAKPPGVLRGLASKGIPVGLVHPLTSIPAGRAGSLEGAVFGLRGPEAALLAAEGLVAGVAGRALRLRGDDRAQQRYHAAASMISGGLAALAGAAAPIAAEALGEEEARAALASLAASVAANLGGEAPDRAATGPVPRGSVELVELHLEALAEADRAAYRQVGRAVLGLVGERLAPDVRASLEKRLGG